MHTIKKYENPITLFHRDGRTWHYKTKSVALNALGWKFIQQNVAAHFRIFSHVSNTNPAGRYVAFSGVKEVVYITSDYIMRDDSGQTLVYGDFLSLYKEAAVYSREKTLVNWPIFHDAKPVAGAGRNHRNYSTYYRRTKQISAVRANQTVIAEADDWLEPKARAALRKMPSLWIRECRAKQR